MRKLFIITFLFVSMFTFANEEKSTYDDIKQATEAVYNDGKSIVSTLYTDAKSLAPSIERFISDIAESLGKGISEVWSYLVLQQTVISITYTIFILFGFYGTYQSVKLYKQNFLNLDVSEKVDKLMAIYTLILFIGGGLATYIGFSNLYQIITGFVNPEYGAIMHILEQIERFK